MPGRTVIKLSTVWKLPLASEIIVLFLRRPANKVKYKSLLRLSKGSRNPESGCTPRPPTLGPHLCSFLLQCRKVVRPSCPWRAGWGLVDHECEVLGTADLAA